MITNTDNIPALTLPPIAAAYDLLSGFETTIEGNRKHIYTYLNNLILYKLKHYAHRPLHTISTMHNCVASYTTGEKTNMQKQL
jgi:hypothetical protein